MHPTRNPLKPACRKQSVELLNAIVADLFDLYARTKQAHWNLRGGSFFALHRLLDESAAALLVEIDETAERATALGGIVEGTLRQAARESRLSGKEEPKSKSGQRDWLKELADALAQCSGDIGVAIERTGDARDFASADRLTRILHVIDKQMWILEAHLNP